MSRALDVYLNGNPAATLNFLGPSNYRLTYLAEWPKDPKAVPVSLSLPLNRRTHEGQLVTDFLDNLLPDSQGVRDEWARQSNLPNAEMFDLLAQYGADVAGAIEFYPEGSSPRTTRSLTPLTDAEVATRIRAIREDDTQWTDPAKVTGKFSLGGAQGKFALALHENKWWDPSGAHPSTHIFKPKVRGLDDAEIIEFITMQSATLLGLPAAAVDLVEFADEHTLLVQRFDRFPDDEGVTQRIHQEDLSQALGVPRIRKYEMHGGPGYRDILGVLDRFPDKNEAELAKERFVKSLVYSWLILNTDAHSKNFSVQILPGNIVLAPLYDVSSFLPYLGPEATERSELKRLFGDSTMSMRPVDSYKVKDMGRLAWWGVAKEAGLPTEPILQWARELCDLAPIAFTAVIDTLEPKFQTAAVDRLRARLPVRASQAQRALTDRLVR